jgi:hypothetical protein
MVKFHAFSLFWEQVDEDNEDANVGGWKLTLDDLDARDTCWAHDIFNIQMKAPLAESPFVVEFESGANSQGCWDCDHMIMQFKDHIDVIKTLHPEFAVGMTGNDRMDQV